MFFATTTSKGQITIPVEVRKMLGIEPGVKVRFEPTEKGVEMKAVKTDSASLMDGMFADGKVSLTIDEINEAVEEAAISSGMKGLGS